MDLADYVFCIVNDTDAEEGYVVYTSTKEGWIKNECRDDAAGSDLQIEMELAVKAPVVEVDACVFEISEKSQELVKSKLIVAGMEYDKKFDKYVRASIDDIEAFEEYDEDDYEDEDDIVEEVED